MKNKYILSMFWIGLLCFAFQTNAQDNKTIIQNYIATNANDLGLNASQLNFAINSSTFLSDKTTKTVYLQQEFAGVRIHDAHGTAVIKNGSVVYLTQSFNTEVLSSITAATPSLTAVDAVNQAVTQMGLSGQSGLKATNYTTSKDVLLADLNIGTFTSPLFYVKNESGNYVLAYEVVVKEVGTHWWMARINAVNGQFINRVDLNINCTFDAIRATDQDPSKHELHSHTNIKNGESLLLATKDDSRPFKFETAQTLASTNVNATYLAYPLRIESPLHGPGNGQAGNEVGVEKRETLVNPSVTGSTVEPSPFGWHDTNGATGAESTITQGNNVFAYLDVLELDMPSAPVGSTQATSPDGGASLEFIYPLDLTKQPTEYYDAAVTNLFVWNNYTHDVWYNYGFDETSGNFQENSYDRETQDLNFFFGYGGDSVNAEAQDESQTATPASSNANMATGIDGGNPRMQMYLWGPPPFGEFFIVNSVDGNSTPTDLVKTYSGSRFPFKAVPRDPNGLQANLVVVKDDMTAAGMEDGGTPGASPDPEDGCTAYTNGAEISGNIAVVRRGVCSFATKIRRAEAAGAIAVIMVNNNEAMPDEVISGGGTPDDPIDIPAVFISFNNGDPLIASLNGGSVIVAEVVDRGPLGVNKDGDLDQGIVAHEYGHGISTRLTGGRIVSNCLTSVMEAGGEQMGEGWSDWFALVMTQELDDVAEQPRGIGTYVLGQDITGSGIRPARYSTDIGDADPDNGANVGINEYTYDDVGNDEVTVPHGVGFIWSTILWDMYWAFIDEYGFDADMYNGTGGNNMVMRLVMDGLKIQDCGNVGFVEGRNSIIVADQNNFNGANECLIRSAFARRGLGALANQGSGGSRLDGVANFDLDTTPPGAPLTGTTFPSENCGAVLGSDDFSKSIFTIFPNPAKNQININSNINSGEAMVSLFDINGRQVISKKVDLTNTAIVNTSGLSTGVYVVKVITETSTHTQKLIIN